MSDFVASDVKTSADARGKRLKSVRKMADLSRKALRLKYQISASTIQAWEEGKAGGLTVKGAQRIINALREEGVCCTTEWLLHGTGQAPYITDRLFLAAAETIEGYSPTALAVEPDNISKELQIFRQGNGDVIDMVICDDGMLPFYQPGDIVAGKRYYNNRIADLVGKDCIIETQTGEIFFRRLRLGRSTSHYHLQCIFLDTTVAEPICYDVTVVSAAPVIWHRRPTHA